MLRSTHIIDLPGLSNVGEVVQGKVYRGAQPSEKEGWASLWDELGIETVINLRQFHEDPPYLDLTMLRFPMHVLSLANLGGTAAILSYFETPGYQPVFVHCAHGQDRTGYICAAYRVMVQGWSVEQAWEELESYCLSPIRGIWQSIKGAVMALKQKEEV